MDMLHTYRKSNPTGKDELSCTYQVYKIVENPIKKIFFSTFFFLFGWIKRKFVIQSFTPNDEGICYVCTYIYVPRFVETGSPQYNILVGSSSAGPPAPELAFLKVQ